MRDLEGREFDLYLRKSKGIRISWQRSVVTKWITRHGGTIAGEYADEDRTAFQRVGAATPPQRDRFTAMLADIAAHPGRGIAAWHADRLTRNSENTEAIIALCASGDHPVATERGGIYNLATASGRKNFRRDSNDAIGEVDHMIERMLEAKQEAREEGRWLGGPRPFGWMPDGMALCRRELHCTKEEAARRGLEPTGTVRTRTRELVVVRLPYDEAAEFQAALGKVIAGESLSAIWRDWRARGVLAATGRPWPAPQNIRRALASPRAAGLATHEGKILGPGNWEPITDELTWRRAHAILTDPARCTTPGPARRWLGSGLYLCGVCGTPVIASSTHDGRGTRKRRAIYRCRRHVARDATALDAYVGDYISGVLSLPEVIDALRGDGPDTAPLQLELERVTAEMDDAAKAAASGEITIRQLAIASAGLLERKARAEAALAAAARSGVAGELLGPDPGPALWDGLTLDGRRAFLSALLTVTIHPAPRGRPAGWKPGQPYLSAMTDYISIVPKYKAAEG